MNFSHTDKNGKANMVDISGKNISERSATAYGEVIVSESLFKMIQNNELTKGDVLSVAKIAGIQAAKKTSELIPLCHNILISKVDLIISLNEKKHAVVIESFAKTTAQTGIEMEALTAVSIAALTVYDMCKAVDKSIVISGIKLLTKSGGKSGDYKREE